MMENRSYDMAAVGGDPGDRFYSDESSAHHTKENLFDFKDGLGLPPSPNPSTVDSSSSRFGASSCRDHLHHAQRSLPLPPVFHLSGSQKSLKLPTSIKAQSQCLQLCSSTAAAADRVAERVADYAATVRHPPHGFETLARDLLDTCQLLFYIEAGLTEAVHAVQALPLDVIAVLDKRFRAAEAEFRHLDHLVTKLVEHERKGALGLVKRGFGKVFKDNSIGKANSALAQTRDELKMNAYMFQWNLGPDRIESELGIGYIGLAAALDGGGGGDGAPPDNRYGRGGSVASEPCSSSFTSRARASLHRQRSPDDWQSSSSSPHRHHNHNHHYHHHHHHPHLSPSRNNHSHNPNHRNLPLQLNATSAHKVDKYGTQSPQEPSRRSSMFAMSSEPSPNTPLTPFTPAAGSDAQNRRKSGVRERLELFDAHHGAARDLDALLADISKFDLGGSKVVRLTTDPAALPQRSPSSNIDAHQTHVKHALVAAIRDKDHKHVLQLLDRGVSPNTGPDVHALNEALRSQDAEAVRLLLLYGAEPNDTDRGGASPLLVAIQRSFVAGACLLLKYGADANLFAGTEVESPTVTAVLANNIRLAHLLLMYGGDANQSTADGNKLLIAAMNGRTSEKLANLLLGYGADPNDKNVEGRTALFEAIQSVRVDLINSLIEHGADPNLPGPKHMLWPATYHPQCLQKLLASGADHRKAPGIMELAASINCVESVRILLDHGVDPNAKKDGVYTPLCSSIRDNRGDILRVLLERGADPNTPASQYPAFKCVTHHREHFLPALVAAGADLGTPRGIVEVAVTSNNPGALGWLLDQGLDVDERSPNGQTALTSAIHENRAELVDALLERGANPHVRGQDWPVCMAVRNPAILARVLDVLTEPRAFKGVMEMAVVADQLESVKLLLAAGVSVEERNGGVFSPLTTAIREHHREITYFLIHEAGADVNAPGEHLPIVKALRRCHADEAEVIEMLLEKGADPNKMYRGWNGVMQALENGDAEMLRKVCAAAGEVDLTARDELGRTVTDIAASRKWQEAVDILTSGGRDEGDGGGGGGGGSSSRSSSSSSSSSSSAGRE